MAQKLDYKQTASDIVRLVGGPENVKSLGHCMTRLRFVLKDEGKADAEAIKKVKGVLGVVSAGGQFMVIMGQNLLPVYEAAIKDHKLSGGAVVEENLDGPKEPLTIKSAGKAVLAYVSASVTPLIAGLVAGGMLKVVLLLINLIPGLNFSSTTTYTLLSAVADAPFFFMPIFVAYGAAVKLGATPLYAMAASAALLHGNYTSLVAAGEAVTMLGIPVRLASYSSSLLPALLIALAACYLEKFFNKIVPGIFKSLLVGLGTIIVTSILGFTILAPLGGYVGVYLAKIFVFLGDTVGIIAVGALAAALPWLVMCGMHTAVAPFMTQALVDPGYDSVFRPAFLLHNMAEGGACLGVAFRLKDPEKRSEALGIAFGCIVAGVTEPAIYGVSLPRKRPMYGVMAGGAIGGVVAAALGARAYVMGYSTIMALPIFEETMLKMLVAVIAAIIGAAVVTFIITPTEEAETAGDAPAAPAAPAMPPVPSVPDDAIVAIANGKMIDITTVNDETFATKVLGDGVAFQVSGDTVCSPCTGTVTTLADTHHAIGVTRPDGVEILIHIGINTVELNGQGFQPLVKEGDRVSAGQPIIKADMKLLKSKGYDTTTMLIITDDNGKTVTFKPYGAVSRGDIVSG